MERPFTLPRLYAILDVAHVRALGLTPDNVLHDWLTAGVRLVQLRAKDLALGPFLELADRMAGECHRAHATFIVNDRVDVARLCGAAGVHLGQADLTPADARALMPGAPWIGVSTHTDAQVTAGIAGPATYLATGPVFPTLTKVAATDPAVGVEGVRRVAGLVSRAHRPLVAIGGITLARAPEVIAAGADSVAVIADLFREGDVPGRARAFLRTLA